MLFKEVTDIYSENHTKQIFTLCRQNTALLNVKESGTYIITEFEVLIDVWC